MYSLYANDDDISYGIQKFIVDTEEDVEFLPKTAKPGSSALVIGSSRLYILNHEKQWKEIKKENGGSTEAFLEWEVF